MPEFRNPKSSQVRTDVTETLRYPALALWLALAFYVSPAQAALKTWVGAGDFGTASNWNPASAPSPSDSLVFDGTSTADASMTSAITVQAFVVKPTYTGNLTLNANLTVTGSLIDLRGGASITLSGASLTPTIGGVNDVFLYPHGSEMWSGVTVSSGTLNILGIGLKSSSFTLSSGAAVRFGTSLTHEFGSLSLSNGTVDFGSSVVRVSANAAMASMISVVPGTGTLEFNGTAAQTFTPSSQLGPNLVINTTTNVTVSSYNMNVGAMAIQSGELYLSSGMTHTAASVSSTGGVLNFGSSRLKVAGDVDLSGLSNVSHSGAFLEFNGSGTQNFKPRASVAHPDLDQTGAGQTHVIANGLIAGNLSIGNGTFDMGAGLNHFLTGISATGGSLDLNSSATHVTGNINLSPLSVLSGTQGKLKLNGSGSQTLTPKSGSRIRVLDFQNPSTVTLSGSGILTDSLFLSTGILNMGGGLTHRVDSGFALTGGTLQLSSCTLQSSASLDMTSLGSLVTTTGGIEFIGTGNKVFKPLNGVAFPFLKISGTGTVSNATYGFDVQTLNMAGGTLDLGPSPVQVGTVLSSGGGIQFNNTRMRASGSSVDFSGLSSVVKGNGVLEFNNASALAFIPPASITLPKVEKLTGVGIVTTNINPILTDTINWQFGTLQLGNGVIHQVQYLTGSGGTVDLDSSILRCTGNGLDLMYSLPSAGGHIEFTGASGTQSVRMPTIGTIPRLVHAGAATLSLQSSLTTDEFSQSDGTLDFNGYDLSVTGNMSITNGDSNSFANLNGRTLSVGGNATLSGQSGNRLNLRSTTAFSLNVTGSLLVDYADIENVSCGSPTGIATHSQDLGGNANWIFSELYSDWSHHKDIFLNSTIGGANISIPVYNAPVLLELDDRDFNWAQVNANGFDLRFAAANGDHLRYHIQSWDATNHKALVWVVLPQIDSNSTTQYLRMHWGNGAAPDSGSSSAVFSSTNGFGAYWHFDANLNDAGWASAHGVNSGTTDAANGFLNRARDFSGSSAYISVPHQTAVSPTSSMTLGGWFYFRNTSTYQSLISKGSAPQQFELFINGGSLTFQVFGVGSVTVAAPSLNSWHQIYAVFSGASLQLYRNGTLLGQTNLSGTPSNGTEDLFLGANPTGSSGFFNGMMDEISISPIPRTANWISANYASSARKEAFLVHHIALWDGGGTGNNWSTAQNWVGDVVPSATDSVVFNSTSSKDVLLTGPVTVSDLNMSIYIGDMDFASHELSVFGDLMTSNGNYNGTGGFVFTGAGNKKVTLGFSILNSLSFQGDAGTFTDVDGVGADIDFFDVQSGTVNLGVADLVVGRLTTSGGTLNLDTATLLFNGDSVDFSGLANLDPDKAILNFASTGSVFTSFPNATFFKILNTGTASLQFNSDIQADSLILSAGSTQLGMAREHYFTAIKATSSATLDFESAHVFVLGDAQLQPLTIFTQPGGKLEFYSESGTQTFTPPATDTLPAIAHSGAGTVQLQAGPLLAYGFHQIAGSWDWAGQDLAIGDSGHMIVTQADSIAFKNFSGSHFQVAGNVNFHGKVASHFGLNPSGSWSMTANGTIQAVLADIGKCTVSPNSVADSSVDMGSNVGWTFLDTIPPAGITSLTATPIGGHAVNLDWNASTSPDADSVQIRYRTDGTFPTDTSDGTLVATIPATDTAYAWTGLPDKTEFSFVVFVLDTAGNPSLASAGSQATATTPDVTAPASVTSLTGNVLGATSITLSWSASASTDADTVMVRYRDDGIHPTDTGNGTLYHLRAATDTVDTLTGLNEKTWYAISLFVRDSSGNWSDTVSSAIALVQSGDATPPANVTTLDAIPLSNASIELSWVASVSSDADSVQIRYRTDGTHPLNETDGTWVATYPAATVLDTVTGLSEKVGYSFGVFVRDSSGNWSDTATGARAFASTPDQTAPNAVSAFNATALSATEIALTWTASTSSDIDSLFLRYRTDGTSPVNETDGTLALAWPVGITADTLTGLTEKTAYAFSLFTRDSAGLYSALVSGSYANVSTPDATPPANVTTLDAIPLSNASIELSWVASVSSDADSVQIRYRTDGTYPLNETDGTWVATYPSATVLDTVTGLSEKVGYCFAVFVRDSSGNWSDTATGARAFASTPDQTPPSDVQQFTATAIGNGKVVVGWTASASTDIDSIWVRYRTDGAYPTQVTDGTLALATGSTQTGDTLTGLSVGSIHHFAAFTRDSSGNFSATPSSAIDTALEQAPVSGSIAFLSSIGYTQDATPALMLSPLNADSLRFGLAVDTVNAPWKSVRSTDSIALPGDGMHRVYAQFKNQYGTVTAWTSDSVILDRNPPTTQISVSGSVAPLVWSDTLRGSARDSTSGVDSVWVVIQRDVDAAYFTGNQWQASAFSFALRTDSVFAIPLAASHLSTGDYSIHVSAKDKSGVPSTSQTSTFNYQGNRAPESIATNAMDTVNQGDAIQWDWVLGDRDTLDTLSTVLQHQPAWASATVTDTVGNATFRDRQWIRLVGQPSQAHVGIDSLVLITTDRLGASTRFTRKVVVLNVNDPPVFAAGQDTLRISEDSLSTWKPFATDADGDALTLSLSKTPAFVQTSAMPFALKPGNKDPGTYSIQAHATDGLATTTMNVTLVVQNRNDAPFAFPSRNWRDTLKFQEDRLDTFTVVVVDMDLGDQLSQTTSLPKWLSVTRAPDPLHPLNHVFTFIAKPLQTDTGSFAATLRFKDASGAGASLNLQATIAAVDDAPVATIVSSQTAGGAARFALAVSDEDGSPEATRFHYRVVRSASDTVKRGVGSTLDLQVFPLLDGAYTLVVFAEDESGKRQPNPARATFTITGSSSLTLDPTRFAMVGIPMARLPASRFVAGSTLMSWNEGGSQASSPGRYLTGGEVDTLRRGQGYWIQPATPVTLSATSEDLATSPVRVQLFKRKQGWNQIAHPYVYPIDMSQSGLQFWEWDDATRDLIDARGILRPWHAYWVQVNADTAIHFPLAPAFHANQGVGKQASLTRALGRQAFALRLSLQGQGFADRDNYIGVRQVQGRATWAASLPQQAGDPQKAGRHLSLHLLSQTAAAQKKASFGVSRPAPTPSSATDLYLSTDLRQAWQGEEMWWDMAVENRQASSAPQLRIDGLDELNQQGLYAFLVNRGEATLLQPQSATTLDLGNQSLSYYSVVVTPHADFAQMLKGSFHLRSNYPNPVTASTHFAFYLPYAWDTEGRRIEREYPIGLEVFGADGRRIATVARDIRRAGYHVLSWKPQTDRGSVLSRGTYFFRLTAGSWRQSRTMTVSP